MNSDFPTSAHSYFLTENIAQARESFLEDPSSLDSFSYTDVSLSEINRRIAAVDNGVIKSNLELVRSAIILRQEPSEENLNEYRQANERLYGAPSALIAERILGKIVERATPEQKPLLSYILKALQIRPTATNENNDFSKNHARLHRHFQDYADISKYGELSKTKNAAQVMEIMLEDTGLSDEGWRVVRKKGDGGARTVHKSKQILIGREYKSRSDQAELLVAVHEVFGHALRGQQPSLSESEGVAILLEQVSLPRLSFRRSYRYLAAALGWGVFGRPMNFQQVWEIIWRAMVIMSYRSEKLAKDYAFNECVRVFRGGSPVTPGAVFLKDTVYFVANQRVWEKIANDPKLQTYKTFVDIIEGRKRVLTA